MFERVVSDRIMLIPEIFKSRILTHWIMNARLKNHRIINIVCHSIFYINFFINLNVSVNDLIGHTARLSSPEFYSDDRWVQTQGFTFLSLRDPPQGLLAPILKRNNFNALFINLMNELQFDLQLSRNISL